MIHPIPRPRGYQATPEGILVPDRKGGNVCCLGHGHGHGHGLHKPLNGVWTPLNFGNDLFFLYDVANANVLAGEVTDVPDQGPLGINVVFPAGSRPVYSNPSAIGGQPAMYFNDLAKGTMAGVHTSGSADWSLFMVLANYDIAYKPQSLCGWSGASGITGFQLVNSFGANQPTLVPNTFLTSLPPSPDPTPDVYVFESNATASTVSQYRAGSLVISKADASRIAVTSNVSGYLGADHNGTATANSCTVAVIGGIKRTVTAADLTNLHLWSQVRFATP